MFKEVFPEQGAVPGAVLAMQSFGDFLGFNPHLHILCSDGCFYGQGMFRVAPRFKTPRLFTNPRTGKTGKFLML
jgi:hypothetical protein